MNIPPKDSFERFGDDLTQVLLGYLPFDDKFKYECISRQWQQLVFNEVNAVNIIGKENQFKKLNDNSFDFSKWMKIFRKLPNVTKVFLSIQLDINLNVNMILNGTVNIQQLFQTMDSVRPNVFQIHEQLIDLVVKECPHLVQLTSDTHTEIIDQSVDKVISKFGCRLNKFHIPYVDNRNLRYFNQLSSMPYLRYLQDDNIEFDDLINGTDVYTKRLEVFSFICVDENVDRFVEFAQIGRNRHIPLSSLSIVIYGDNEVVDKVINSVQCFGTLKQLSLCLESQYHANRQQFQQLVRNCPKIKRFGYSTRNTECNRVIADINQVFGGTHVTALYIGGIGEDNDYFVLTSDMLNRLRQLRRLTIANIEIDDRFFANLAVNLPKVYYLALGPVILTNQSLQSLCQMRRLATLRVFLSKTTANTYSRTELMNLKMRPKFRHFYKVRNTQYLV